MLIKNRIIQNKIESNNYNNKYIINDYDNYLKFDFSPIYREKLYNTELLLITNSDNLNDIYLWLDWHLNIIKFEHIILVDNNNIPLLNDICQKFNNVKYIHKPGILSQSEIYTEYVNKSNAKWVLPIDDDEYLYISNKFNNNINVYIEYLQSIKPMYKYSFNWHMMYSDHLKENREGKNLFEDFPYEYIGNTFMYYDNLELIKTLVNTEIKHLYINENNPGQSFDADKIIDTSDKNIFTLPEDFLGLLHNPISKKNNEFVHSYNEETNKIYPGTFNNGEINPNANAFLMHFKYRTKTEWMNKIDKFKFTNISNKYKNACYNSYKIIRCYKIINKSLLRLNNKLLDIYDNKKTN